MHPTARAAVYWWLVVAIVAGVGCVTFHPTPNMDPPLSIIDNLDPEATFSYKFDVDCGGDQGLVNDTQRLLQYPIKNADKFVHGCEWRPSLHMWWQHMAIALFVVTMILFVAGAIPACCLEIPGQKYFTLSVTTIFMSIAGPLVVLLTSLTWYGYNVAATDVERCSPSELTNAQVLTLNAGAQIQLASPEAYEWATQVVLTKCRGFTLEFHAPYAYLYLQARPSTYVRDSIRSTTAWVSLASRITVIAAAVLTVVIWIDWLMWEHCLAPYRTACLAVMQRGRNACRDAFDNRLKQRRNSPVVQVPALPPVDLAHTHVLNPTAVRNNELFFTISVGTPSASAVVAG